MKKYIAEFIGTFTLVFFGTGIAVLSNGNLVATALAFGLAIVASAYVIGSISGCHVNPAVSLAVLLNGGMTVKEFAGYVAGQVLGAFAGTGLLWFVLKQTDINPISFGANGFDALSATNITIIGAIVVEIILTLIFVYTILGVTSDEKKANVAPIVIGLTLTFVHLIGINLTGTSVNPARSLAPALFVQGIALQQVWVFIVAPFIGSAIAAFTFKLIKNKE